MKPLHCIAALVLPLLAACDPMSSMEFEPQIAGRPLRTPQDHAKLEAVVAGIAKRRGYTRENPSLKARERENHAVDLSKPKPVVLYWKDTEKCTVSMDIHRDRRSDIDKVTILDFPSFKRSEESKLLEAEIRKGLH